MAKKTLQQAFTEMTEADIKYMICQYLDRFPDQVLFTVTPPKRTRYSSRYMREGWPDISGVFKAEHLRPHAFFIEVKKPGGTLSIEQHNVLEKAKQLGAITCVATCVEDVMKVLGI